MDGRRITLMDVAQRAGVSRTTASFVLSGRREMRISEDAQQRVLQAARELNYRPNLLARSLRTNMSQTIGLISDVIATEPFAGESIRGSIATALLHHHLLFVGETEGDPEVEKQLVQAMLDRGVGGFVYGSMYTREANPSKLLRGHPLVMMNCHSRSRGIPTVLPDEREAGRAAVQALLDAGHSTGIYLIGETLDRVLAGHERRAGIEQALAEHSLALAGWTQSIWWPGPSLQAVAELLDSDARPTALICMNDRVAMGAYQALRRRRVEVPRDVSVLSFDDSDLAGWLDPPVSSIAIPHFELGRRSVELLLQPDPEPRTHLIPMPLHRRESIAPPRRRRRP